MFVERNYSYNGKIKSFNVINEQGENFIRVRDLADLLNKNISYDNKTKITNLDDIFSNINVEIGNKNTTVKAINSGGFNFVKVRDLADVLGYETGYNETNNSIFFNLKKSIIDKFVKAINSGGFNFVKVRDLADVLGYETGYNETNNSIFFNLKKSIIDKLKLLKSR